MVSLKQDKSPSRSGPIRIPAPASLVEDARVHEVVEKIVRSLSSEASLHQDLMQEALLHLWRLERQRPHQTTSWYLQSCRFRLQHYLCAGRSVDSAKRRRGQMVLPPHDDSDSSSYFDQFATDQNEFDETSAKDMVSTLASQLKPKERAVLDCLADGLSATEISRKLKLSSPTVTKYRRKIARYVVKLRVIDGRVEPRAPGHLVRRMGARSC